MKAFQTPLLPGDWQQVNRNNNFRLRLTLLTTLNTYSDYVMLSGSKCCSLALENGC